LYNKVVIPPDSQQGFDQILARLRTGDGDWAAVPVRCAFLVLRLSRIQIARVGFAHVVGWCGAMDRRPDRGMLRMTTSSWMFKAHSLEGKQPCLCCLALFCLLCRVYLAKAV
jgi:hypothetical protein